MHPATTPSPSGAPEPVRVLKFGGATLADGASVRRVLALARPPAGTRHVLVVSAVGDVTALLERSARAALQGAPDGRQVRLRHKRLLGELDLPPGLLNALLSELDSVLADIAARGHCSGAQRDHLLSFGERLSARLVAAALRADGVAATPVDAWDVGLLSDSNHGRARPRPGATRAIGRTLASVPGVAVVTGFVAADGEGRLTTLGPDGSDLSAALIAEAVGACEVQFWKRVGGVHCVDPRLVPRSGVMGELSYAQAAALAHHGAGVLHPDTLTPLERAGIPARVLALDEGPRAGTRIAGDCRARGVLGLAVRGRLARVRLGLAPLEERSVAAARLGAALASHALEPIQLAGGPGEFVLVAPDGEELARLASGFRRVAPDERPLAALALVAASPAELDFAAADAALGEVRADVLAGWVDHQRGSAVWLLREAGLVGAARALHARLLAPELPPAAPRAAALGPV